MKQKLRHLREMVLYFLIPAAGFLSPLLVIPSVTARFGTSGWTGVAVAQSLGASIAVATEMGWGVVGPQRVAGLPRHEAIGQYRLSLTSRPLTVVPGILAAFAITAIVVHDYRWPSAILAAGIAGQAMTPSWYFIGTGMPLGVLWSESLPRVLIALLSAVALHLGAPLVTYSLLMCLTAPIAQIVARRLIGPDAKPTRSDWRAGPATARAQLIMGSGRAVSVLYTAFPITFVQIFAPGATAVFAATERLMRMGITVLQAVPLRLQSWVGQATESERAHRIRRAQQIAIVMGVVAGTSYAALAPTVSKFVFSGAVTIPYRVAAASGLLMCIICISTGLGLSMVATGQANRITAAIIPSAVVAVSTIGFLAAAFGPVGAIAAEILAELTGLAIQFFFLRHYARKMATPRGRHWAQERIEPGAPATTSNGGGDDAR